MILAIDPGASGGLAWGASAGTALSASMPDSDDKVLALIRSLAQSGVTVAYIELVGGFVGKAQPGSAMFKFGNGYGFLRGCCMASGISVVMVRPQEWQKALNLGTTKQAGGKAQWKNKLKAEAQRLFSGLKVTLKTADALLLLEFARRHSI